MARLGFRQVLDCFSLSTSPCSCFCIKSLEMKAKADEYVERDSLIKSYNKQEQTFKLRDILEPKTVILRVSMHCGGCAKRVQKHIKKIIIWKRLEEENPGFFEAYHFRLLLKSQIHIFNKLLKRQHELMQKIPLSNRPTSSWLQPQYYLLDHASTPSRPNNNMYCNGGSNGTISANQSTPHLLSTLHNSQMERSNGMNGISETSIKSEAISNSSFALGSDNDNSLLDMQTFPGSEPLLDNQSSSFGFLSQIPQNLSFSDLTDDLIYKSVLV